MGLEVVISLPEKDLKREGPSRLWFQTPHQPQEIQIWAGEYPNNNKTTWAGSG